LEDNILKKYEAIFILDIRKVEDEGDAFSKEFAAMIKEWGGNMAESIAMGRNQFAREIKKRKAGIYWNFVFEVDADKIIAIKNQYRLDERVLRNMIINYDRPEAKVEDQG
jgi:small subunit ribosomal protein S6